MEAGWFKLNGICRHGELLVVVCLSFGRRDIADGFKQAVVVEPRHPFKRSQFDGLHRFPRGTAMDQLSLVEAIDSFRQCVVVAVAPTSYRRFYARLAEALGVADGNILRTSV